MYKDLIEQVLRRAGVRRLRRSTEGGWGCCCPFHDERSPSFAVNDSGLWTCYAQVCGRKGNLYSLLTQLGGYQPAEAAQIAELPPLTDQSAVTIQMPATLAEARQRKRKEPLAETEATVYSLYCPKYLLDRGFTKETLRHFGVGYDQEAGQVVIPLRDGHGNLVGFVRRQQEGSRGPKYLVDLPDGSRVPVLFNLHRAGQRIILVEGALDAMWLHQHGIHNGVALLGSKLSHGQMRLLLRHVTEVVLMLDNDPTGYAATCALVDRLYKLVRVTVAAPFEQGKDAADQTAETLNYCLTHAMSARRWLLRFLPTYQSNKG